MDLNISVCEKYLTYDNMPETSKSIADEFLNYHYNEQHANEDYKHWEMMLHCEIAEFPRAAPNLRLPSREARFYWHLYVAAAKHLRFYQKDVNHAFLVTLPRIIRSGTDHKNIKISDHLLRLKTFDYVDRKRVINLLERLLRKETTLESICLEGLSLTATEGVRLLLALYNSRKTMKYVYCWRAFDRKRDPLPISTEHSIGSRFYTTRKIRKCDWFRAIGCLECLTTLSVNYAFIATPTGDFLVNLAKLFLKARAAWEKVFTHVYCDRKRKLGTTWNWLQLLCLEEEIPCEGDFKVDRATRVIPDEAWREVRLWAPALQVQYAIVGIPEYDRHKWFFATNTPTHTFALTTDIDFRFRQPCLLGCTIRTLKQWYSRSLVHLYLQLWHQREDMDSQVGKLFLDFPVLRVFGFVGEIRKLKTLCRMCCQIRTGKCSVQCVNIQLQNVIHGNGVGENWRESVKCLMICFKQDFERLGVTFDIDFNSR